MATTPIKAIEAYKAAMSHTNNKEVAKAEIDVILKGNTTPEWIYDFNKFLIDERTTGEIIKFVDELLHQELQKAREVTEDTSDGYHTFKELYEFRLLYNAHLFNEWAKQGMYDVHKSQRHNDGELCFGRDDYFVVVATLPTGQISNHYPMSDWDLFYCEAVEKAKAIWDGHTSKDVAQRLRGAINQSELDQPNK